jgi:hypothetical protein
MVMIWQAASAGEGAFVARMERSEIRKASKCLRDGRPRIVLRSIRIYTCFTGGVVFLSPAAAEIGIHDHVAGPRESGRAIVDGYGGSFTAPGFPAVESMLAAPE